MVNENLFIYKICLETLYNSQCIEVNNNYLFKNTDEWINKWKWYSMFIYKSCLKTLNMI